MNLSSTANNTIGDGTDANQLTIKGIPTTGTIPNNKYELIVNGDELVTGTLVVQGLFEAQNVQVNGYLRSTGSSSIGSDINTNNSFADGPNSINGFGGGRESTNQFGVGYNSNNTIGCATDSGSTNTINGITTFTGGIIKLGSLGSVSIVATGRTSPATITLPSQTGTLAVILTGHGTLSGGSATIAIAGATSSDFVMVSRVGTHGSSPGLLTAIPGNGSVKVESSSTSDIGTVNVLIVRQ